MISSLEGPLLGVIEGLDAIGSTRNLSTQYGPIVTQGVLILCVGLGVGIVCMLAVKFFHRHERRRSHSGPSGLPSTSRHRSGRRKRIRRTEHRPRMPTLSETGGLPPLRPEDPPNSSP